MTVSRELALLLHLTGLRVSPTPMPELVENDFDWTRFAALADRHQVSAVIWSALATLDQTGIPNELKSDLAEHQATTAIRAMAQEAEAVRISDHLASAGIRGLHFKGVACSHLLYGDAARSRFAGDMDILVAPGDLVDAVSALREAGFAFNDLLPMANEPSFDLFLDMKHAVNLENSDTGTGVDLHHRLTHNPHWMNNDFQTLWSRSQTLRLESGDIQTLGDADNAEYLCCHMCDHPYIKLKWLNDASRALARLENGSAGSQQSALAGTSVVSHAKSVLAKIQSVGHAPTSEPLLTPLNMEHVLSELESTAQPNEHRSFGTIGREISLMVQRARLSGSWKSALWDFRDLACDPRDVHDLGLGRRWEPLYLMLGPVFSLVRFMKRGGDHR
ncbi:MAG: nucleotidyltransferase family protein [Pseudomonadota bacterium]